MKSCVRIAQPDARGLPVDVDEHGQQLAVKLFQQRPDHLALRRGTRCLQHVGVHHERRQQLGYHAFLKDLYRSTICIGISITITSSNNSFHFLRL